MSFSHEQDHLSSGKVLRKTSLSFEKGNEQSDEQIEKTFEYKDAQGEKICDARIVYGPSELIPGLESEYGRRVLIYEIMSPSSEEGKASSHVDLMRFWNSQLRKSVPTFVVDRDNKATYYSGKERRVVISRSKLEGPFGVATMGHEYGHARQYEDPLYDDVIDVAYGMEKYLSPDSPQALATFMKPEFFAALSRTVPEAYRQTTLDTAQAIIRKGNEIASLKEKMVVMETKKRALVSRVDIPPEEKVTHLKNLEIQMDVTDLEIERLKIEYQTLKAPLFAFLDLATQIKERNASAYELRDLRAIRYEHGMDFFAPLLQERRRRRGKSVSTHEGTDRSCETSLYAFIDDNLGTYEATTREMIKRYGSIPSPFVASLPDVWKSEKEHQLKNRINPESIHQVIQPAKLQPQLNSMPKTVAMNSFVQPSSKISPVGNPFKRVWGTLKDFLNGK